MKYRFFLYYTKAGLSSSTSMAKSAARTHITKTKKEIVQNTIPVKSDGNQGIGSEVASRSRRRGRGRGKIITDKVDEEYSELVMQSTV